MVVPSKFTATDTSSEAKQNLAIVASAVPDQGIICTTHLFDLASSAFTETCRSERLCQTAPHLGRVQLVRS